MKILSNLEIRIIKIIINLEIKLKIEIIINKKMGEDEGTHLALLF